MAKIVAAMNMTIDGFCDHTSMIADDEIHQHYTELLRESGAVIYGRKTYQLMEYWRPFVADPTGNPATDDFAVVMDNIPKIVFSRTLKELDWPTARLATRELEVEVLELRQQEGKPALVGSPGLIAELTRLRQIDEYQLSVQPTVIGNGLQLFRDIKDRVDLKLSKTKTFDCGAVTLYYEPTKR
ncbi:MAG: dihydrofolate reductase family protein [Pyrinomonadaceae bacterium]